MAFMLLMNSFLRSPRKSNMGNRILICPLCGESDDRWHNAKICWSCARLIYKSQVESYKKVRNAIMAGKLPSLAHQMCVDCGKPAKCYDHRDYNQPLKVEPVCTSCNKKRGYGLPIYGLSLDGGAA